MAFRHNHRIDPDEPPWRSIDKAALPPQAFALVGDPQKKSTWRYPHHWVKGGTRKNEDGTWADGELLLHRGGLLAAWAAANGARTGRKAPADVIEHLQAHRRALGLDAAASQGGAIDAHSLQLTGSVQLAADAGAQANSLPRFTLIAYTGGPMRPAGWGREVVIDLQGVQVPRRKLPVLLQHDVREIVGHTTDITVDADGIVAYGVVSAETRAARTIVSSARRGFPWQVSLGADVLRVESVEEGATVTVNGREFRGPLYVVRAARLKEVSFVSIAADEATEASVTATTAMQGESPMADQPRNPDASRKPEDIQAQAATPPTQPDGRDTVGADDVVRTAREALAAEQERVAGIRRIAAQYGVDTIRVDDRDVDLVAHATRAGWSIERTELEALRASRPAAPAVQVGPEAPDARTVEAALCLSAGIPEQQVGQWYGEQVLERATRPDLRGAGIHTVLHYTIRAAGKHARSDRVTDDVIRTAFEAERTLTASGGFSLATVSGILGNVANKALLRSFTAVKRAVPEVAAASDHSDFKQHTKYRLTAAGRFEKVGEAGELKSADLGEESYTNKVDTYGRIITLTRQMIINDDLGAFLQIPRILGRMAALALERAAFEALLSPPSGFFGSANSFSGASSALSVDSLSTAEQLFLDQTDANGEPILVAPAILLVPTSLSATASNLMSSQFLITGESKTRPQNNPHAGKYRVVVSPYLNAQGLTGSSSTAWYLLADPADLPAIEVAYLRGQRTPTIERGDTDFDTLGVKWRGYFDFGVALQDNRAIVKSAGA